jgi:DNA-binding NarL/FixJ family response regulator
MANRYVVHENSVRHKRYLSKKQLEAMVFNRRGQVIELFFGAGLQMKDIAELLDLHVSVVSADITHYFKKPLTNLTLKSKI